MKTFTSKILKAAALSAVVVGISSEVWGSTTYAPGTEIDDRRVDTVTLTANVGNAGILSGYTDPSTSATKYLIINLVTFGTPAACEDNTDTDFYSYIKSITLRGEATGFNTVVSTAAKAFALPPANCKLIFDLVTAPAGNPTAWFQTAGATYSAKLATWTVSVEPGSASPKFPAAFIGGVANFILGESMTLVGAPTFVGTIKKHPKRSSAPTLTLAGHTSFQQLSGVALDGATGAYNLTFNKSCTLEDTTNQSTGTLTVAANQVLTLKGNALAGAAFTTVLPASGNVTCGTGARIVFVGD